MASPTSPESSMEIRTARPRTSTFQDFVRNPAASQKLLALGLLIASIVAAGYGVHSLRSGSDRVLFRGLSEEEAARTVERLNSSGIRASLGSDGVSVRVSSGDVDQARLLLATNGMPATGRVGFELFDGQSFGMTNFMEQVNYRRALEGELARTINAIGEVAQTRVHLVLPRESIYASESEPAKASVSLKLHSGKALGHQTVNAIVNLVASSVEGLEPGQVVVVDSYGRTLHDGGEAADNQALTDGQLGLRSKVERELAAKAIAILEPLVGDGRVRARASAEMSFDRTEETLESFDPEGSVILSQQKDEELQVKPNDGIGQSEGVPGTESNPPDDGSAVASASAQPEGDVTLSRRRETVNYEVSKRTRHVTTPVGRIGRRSVAVVVDDAEADAGADAGDRRPRTAEEMEKFRLLVVAALGLDTEAGDVVTVENISFDGIQEPTPMAPPSSLEQFKQYVTPLGRHLSWLALLAVFYMVVFRPVMKKLSEPSFTGDSETSRLSEGGYGQLSPGVTHALSAGNVAGSEELLQKAQEATRREPEMASQLVRNWLSEGESR